MSFAQGASPWEDMPSFPVIEEPGIVESAITYDDVHAASVPYVPYRNELSPQPLGLTKDNVKIAISVLKQMMNNPRPDSFIYNDSDIVRTIAILREHLGRMVEEE